jgi:hypothetical protein
LKTLELEGSQGRREKGENQKCYEVHSPTDGR